MILIKQRPLSFILLPLLLLVFVLYPVITFSYPVSAQECSAENPELCVEAPPPGSNGTPIATGAECGAGSSCCGDVATTIEVDCGSASNPILGYLGGIMNFLAAGVGIVVVAMVVLAGVQYITSRGDPQKLSAAKSRLTNALIGLLCFIFLYAFLQWLLPSGLIGGGGSGGEINCSENPEAC